MFSKKGGQIIFSRRIAGCCRRVLVVVLVSVLLVSACTPASEEEGSGGSPGGGGLSGGTAGVSGSPVSPPLPSDVGGVSGGVFTEVELEELREGLTEGELEGLLEGELEGSLAGVIVQSAGSETAEAFFNLFKSWAEDASDGELLAFAYYTRYFVMDDSWGIDGNDLSTPTGAFCWVLLRLRWALPMPPWFSASDWSARFLDLRSWNINNFNLWFFEGEAADRGLELSWVTAPADYNRSLRRFLLQATAPEVKDVVLSEDLPALLRPAAEEFYDLFDRLLELEVYRVRPTIEELSVYPDLAGLTAGDVRRIWPEIVELKLSEGDYEEYVELFRLLEEGEGSGLLNSECKQRTGQEMRERACPTWVAEDLPLCMGLEDEPVYAGSYSDCLFGCPQSQEGPLVPQPFEGFLSVSAGLDYACGVRPSGSVWCWNWWYLGDGDRGNDGTPSFLGHAFSFVDAGWDSACGLHRDGEKLDCWNARTPLGELESPAGEFKEVSAGIEHACAIRANASLACWGIDPAGAKVSPPAGEFVSVDVGWDGDVHLPEGDTLDDGGLSCGLRVDSVVECWGEQNLTYGEGSDRGDEFADVAVGRSGQVCVLRTDGIIHCGEDRIYGSDYPQGNRFTQVSVDGLNHTCGLRANDAVECWEASGDFLGSIPGPFTELEVGYTYADIPYACGLLEDGRILCWDLIEEVFTWAAEGLEKYTHPQCFPDIEEGHECWTAGIDPPREIDDRYVKESPILLPHSNSVLPPDSDSN